MIGAIAGDIIGSVCEHYPIKTKDFPLFHPQCCFTDDSVLTIAVAKAILEDQNYLKAVLEIGRKYPNAGYGGSFIRWLHSNEPRPYNSWGNGSACGSVQSALPSIPLTSSSRRRNVRRRYRTTTLKV